MKRIERQQLYRAVVCAIFAGVIAAPFAEETAYALPVEGTNAAANAGTADISTADKTMNIAGKNDHNILKWEDFSVEKDETVKFDGGAKTRDYLNLVTGEGASNIYGTIEGGRNVYLVNPHGILFAEGSAVNTGALYLSTANPADIAAATSTFKANGTSPLTATAQMGNVLNLGTVQANSLYIEGKNVTVLDTNNVTDEHGTPLRGTVGGIGTKAKVRIYSEQTPHIGYEVANTTTIKINVNGKDKQYTVSDYANPRLIASASVRAWDVKKLNGGGDHSGYDYMLVHDVYELQNMDARVDMRHGRYMLAHDIDARATRSWYPSTYMGKTYYQGFLPVGRVDEGEGYSNPFKGRFDGVGHKITGLHIERSMVAAGLFSRAWGAVIENVSISEGYVEGTVGFGGFVGNAEAGSIIRNVSFSGKVCFAGADSIGGIVGWGSNFTIENACNKGTVSAEASEKIGGIIGEGERVTLKNVCNEGTVTGRAQVGGIAGSIKESTVQNALHTGTVRRVASAWDGSRAKSVGSIVGTADNSRIRGVVWREGGFTDKRENFPTDPPSEARTVGELLNHSTVAYDQKRSMAEIKQAATYQDWKDDQGKAVVSGEGGKGTPWRIYEGHTTPLLTGLMRGTKWVKNAEKVYDGAALTGTDHIRFDAEKNVGTYHAYSETYDLIGGAYTIKKRTLTLADVAAQTKTYDGNTAADASKFRATLAGVVKGEENSVSATATGAAYNDKNVARANTVHYTGVALTGTGTANYTIAGTAEGAGRITPKQLNLALAGGARFDKTYDGNANVTQTLTKGTHYTLTGFVGTEGTGIGLSSATGKYTDKNAGAGKNVRFDGLRLTGAGADNYATDKTALTGTGTIARRVLTLGAVESQTKTYDGTRAADASKFRAGLNHAVAGDDITAAAAGAAYNDKNVARANRIDYTGLTLTGTDAGNYTLAATTAQGAGAITPRALTLGAVAAQTKTYDGNTAADASKFQGALAGVVNGEENSVSATAAGAAYNDKNVAAANTVHYTGVALTGTGAGNYTIATTAEGAGTITQRVLTLGAVASQEKTYDGTTSADAAQFHATLGGFVAGEENSVSATAAGAAYNDKNVARANRIDYTGVALTGTGAGNYTIANTAQGAGAITRRALTLGAVEAQTKTYDGNTAADTAKFRAGLNNAVAGDDITAAAAGAAYNDKNVAGANRIDYTGLTLTGADAGNYTLAAGAAEGAGTITRRMLTFDDVAAQTKTYDGNTAADASKFRATLAGVVKGEENSVSATATGAAYNDKNVARANTVHYTGVALTGTGTANYTIAGTAEGAGRITPKQLNLALAGGARFDKTYDGTANVTQSLTKGGNYTLDGFVGTEGTGIELSSATGKYTDKNAGTDKNVRFDGLRLTGDGAGNYVPDKTTLTGTGTITRRALTLGAVEMQTKTYDGTTAADTAKFRARLNHAVAGDDITAAATGAAYNDKNVAGASRVDYTGVALKGTDAGNYTLAATTAEGAGAITHRTLTLTADVKHAVQGRRLPDFTGRADGFARGEDMRVFAPGSLTFKSDVANTDTAGKYAVTGSIDGVSGGILGNYRITQAAGNARAFIIHVAPGVSGLFTSLVQEAKPVFDDGFSKTVDVFGVLRPFRAATLGIYRFDAETDLENRGMRL